MPYNIGHFKILGPLCLLMILPFVKLPPFSTPEERKNLLKIYWLPIITIILSIATGVGSFIGSTILLSTFLLCHYEEVRIPKKYLNILSIVTIISCGLQVYFLRGAGRPSLFIGDPNFSGMYMLILLFFFARINNYVGQLFCLICSFFFLSRAYLYSIFIFYSLFLFQLGTKKKVPFYLLGILIVSNILFMTSSFTFFSEALRHEKYYDGVDRLFPQLDSSVQHRFEIVKFYVNHIIEEPLDLLWGIPKYEKVFRKNLMEGIIHNSFLSIVARFGIVVVTPYLLLIKLVYNRAKKINGMELWWEPLFYSWCFFSLFLHGLFETYLIMGLIAVIFFKVKKED